jgi:hypothetical protein
MKEEDDDDDDEKEEEWECSMLLIDQYNNQSPCVLFDPTLPPHLRD